jgi:N-methylhydantoinase A/oxoprolinase/acetone carboxylase beta subunit
VKSPKLETKKAAAHEIAHVGTAAFARPGRARLGSISTPKSPVLFDGKKFATPVHPRESLQPGKTYSGPAIITEYSATTVIPPNKHFHLDPAGNLLISIHQKHVSYTQLRNVRLQNLRKNR